MSDLKDLINTQPAHKRFLVTDVFHEPKKYEETKDWVDVKKELPKEMSGIFCVRLETGDYVLAYYYEDGYPLRSKSFGDKCYKFWCKVNKDPLDVTHWGR